MVSKNPVKLGYDEPVSLKFENAERSLDIKLANYTSQEELMSFLPNTVLATWTDSPYVKLSNLQKAKTLRSVFAGKTIPAAKRFMNLTWSFNNISMQEVTHILRYPTWTFIAQCSDTISWRDKTILVPDSIINSKDLFDKFKKTVTDAFQLYADMVDTRDISLLDARHVFNRAASTFYWVHNDVQSAQKFINDRVSEEFQPQFDNIIAYQMAIQIESAYPLASGMFDLDRVDNFYGKMIEDHGRTFQPRAKAKSKVSDEMLDTLDFAYDKTRDEYRGTNKPKTSAFEQIKSESIDKLNAIRAENNKKVENMIGMSLDELDNLPQIV